MSANLNPAAESKSGANAHAAVALDVLRDIELPVTLRFGRTQMSLEEVLRLDTGSVVEFDRALEDPVEVLVNGRVVARGQAVMVQGHYGVRISDIASRQECLDSTYSAMGRAVVIGES